MSNKPTFCERKTVKRARKDHQCSECGGQIEKGNSYEYTNAVFDGRGTVTKKCNQCLSNEK